MPMEIRLPLVAIILAVVAIVWRRSRTQPAVQPARPHSPRDYAAIRQGRALYERAAAQLSLSSAPVGPAAPSKRQEKAAEERDDDARTRRFPDELKILKKDHPVTEHEPESGDKTLLMSTGALEAIRLAELREPCEFCGKDHEGECPEMIEARGSRDFVVVEADELEPIPAQDPDPVLVANGGQLPSYPWHIGAPEEIVDGEIVDEDPEPAPEPPYTETYFDEWVPDVLVYDPEPVVARIRAMYDDLEHEHWAAFSMSLRNNKPFQLSKFLVSA